MKERPILFSAPMVRAILDGSKTQTRRIIKKWEPDPLWDSCEKTTNGRFCFFNSKDPDFHGYLKKSYPHGKIGDRLWVRETFIADEFMSCRYKADGQQYIKLNGQDTKTEIHCLKWTPSIYMPRWASRITLEITDVRVERLNDISEADAFAEGIEVDPEPWDQTIAVKNYLDGSWIPKWDKDYETAGIKSFSTLWESINGPGSWQANPWVFAIDFKKV